MSGRDIAEEVREALAEILPMEDIEAVQPTMVLDQNPLCADAIDVMDLVLEMEEALNIQVSTHEEESLNEPGKTVQDAIELFTKLYNEQHPHPQ